MSDKETRVPGDERNEGREDRITWQEFVARVIGIAVGYVISKAVGLP